MLKVIIVDDEEPARSELRYMLEEAGQVEVVAEAKSVREAIAKIKEHACDVVFLDIGMPDASGLQLAEAMRRLGLPISVVFVTAHAGYALDAFGVNAVDYLVKPVDAAQLDRAVARVGELVELNGRAQRSVRISVDKGGRKGSVGIGKVRFITARDDYSYLRTDEGRYFSTASLAQLERRLEGQGFFRAHRGYLVNLSMIEEVEAASGGTLLLTMDGIEEKIPVARRRTAALKRALGI